MLLHPEVVSALHSSPPCIIPSDSSATAGHGNPVFVDFNGGNSVKLKGVDGSNSLQVSIFPTSSTCNSVNPLAIIKAIADTFAHLKEAPRQQCCNATIAEAVVECLLGPSRGRKESWKVTPENRSSLTESASSYIARRQPIEMISIWGGLKLLGTDASHREADLAEYLVVQKFNAINNAVKAFYPPGIKVRIILEDVGEKIINERCPALEENCALYKNSIQRIINHFGGSHIEVTGESSMMTAAGVSQDEFTKTALCYAEHFSQFLTESTTGRFGSVCDNPEKIESFKILSDAGWKGTVPELQRLYYKSRIDNYQGSPSTTSEYIRQLSLYLGTAFARSKLRIFRSNTLTSEGSETIPIKASFVAYPPGTPPSAERYRIEYKASNTPGSDNCITPWCGIGAVIVPAQGEETNFTYDKIHTKEEFARRTLLADCVISDSSGQKLFSFPIVSIRANPQHRHEGNTNAVSARTKPEDLWQVAFPPPEPTLLQQAFRKANSRGGTSILVDTSDEPVSHSLRPNVYKCESALYKFPIIDNREAMIDLQAMAKSLQLPMHFLHDGELYVRTSVAKRLMIAAEEIFFRSQGEVILAINEGHRSLEAQREMFDKVFAEKEELYPPGTDRNIIWSETTKVVADPYRGVPPHSTGGAVDVTLYSPLEEKVLDLGTPINQIDSDLAHTWHPALNKQAWEMRCMLSQAMESAGFVNLPTEWWHWSFGDSYACSYKGEPHAFYDGLSNIIDAQVVQPGDIFPFLK